ncbi:MAG: hypothetical protein V4672_03920 [Verrucomicrobiota bacterium]
MKYSSVNHLATEHSIQNLPPQFAIPLLPKKDARQNVYLKLVQSYGTGALEKFYLAPGSGSTPPAGTY